MGLKNNKGQNVIEYLIVCAGVLVVLIYFTNTGNSPMKRAVENVFNDAVYELNHMNGELRYK